MNNINKLSAKALWKTFLPLSLSDMIMVVAAPLTGMVLSRLPDSKVHLAAQGAAQTMAILLESPIIMMLHAANAAASNKAAYKTLGALMWTWNAVITLLYAVVAFTPVYPWVTEVALGLPHDVALAARPAFGVMLLWPAAIGIRRYLQGQLIHHRRSREIMFAGFVRLGTLVTVLVAGALAGLPGATAAGLAAVASVITEAISNYHFARRLRRELALQPEPETPAHSEVPVKFGRLFWWYLPLAGTQVLVWLARPLITSGIARAGLAALSLAAWPTAWSTVSVLANGTRAIQQLTISQVRDNQSFVAIRRFSLWTGLAFSAALGVLAFTPLADVYLELMFRSDDLVQVSKPVLALAAIFPLQVTVQNWMQGLLVMSGRTGRVNLGAFAGGVATVGTVFAGALVWDLPGTALAAAASVAGLLVELACLWYFSAPVRHRFELDLESLGQHLIRR